MNTKCHIQLSVIFNLNEHKNVFIEYNFTQLTCKSAGNFWIGSNPEFFVLCPMDMLASQVSELAAAGAAKQEDRRTVHCIGWEHPTSNGRLNCCTLIELEKGKHKHNFPKRCQACKAMVLRLQQVVQQNEKRCKAGKSQRSRNSLRDLAAKHYADRQFPDHQTFVGPSVLQNDAPNKEVKNVWAPATGTKCVKCSATVGAFVENCIPRGAQLAAKGGDDADHEYSQGHSDCSKAPDISDLLDFDHMHRQSTGTPVIADAMYNAYEPQSIAESGLSLSPMLHESTEAFSDIWASNPAHSHEILMSDGDSAHQDVLSFLGVTSLAAGNERVEQLPSVKSLELPRLETGALAEAESATIEALTTLREARAPPRQTNQKTHRRAVRKHGCVQKRWTQPTAGQLFHEKWVKRNVALLASYLC
jgi:hypothetical protein